MASFTTPLDQAQPKPDPVARDNGNAGDAKLTGSFDEQELLDLWEIMKHECYDNRWIFERQWQRNLWYVLGRQWIEYQSKYGGWRDKRMAAWIPRPVTNKCKETVQAIRAMFTSINLSVNVRPNGTDPKNVAAAATADKMAPLLHEVHLMDQAMTEFDFWLLVTGNAFLHTYLDYDVKHGMINVNQVTCAGCGETMDESKLEGAQATCPECGAMGAENFTPAIDPITQQPLPPKETIKGMPATMVLSPLEIAFPNAYTRFDDVPYVVRARWRTKRYFESHPDPDVQALVPKITWTKAPQDHSMALFTSLVQTNDLGITPIYWSEGSGRGGQNDEGITEHEVWMKPTKDYPDGLVFRIVGDAEPLVVKIEAENLPGPLPYVDAEKQPLFTFTHATFEHVGGRILGSGALDQVIQKQDQLNQLDSQILLCLQRMANPVWLEPKGAEIQKLTGMPGLVIKWNPLTVGGQAKPERIAGVPIDASLMQLRELYLRDIEELTGTFDILKGQKPAGVEAFSAIQALIERSQARFSSVFKSRGNAYKNWYKFAIELERSFGPNERVRQTMTPARTWTFELFENTQLQGSVNVVIEDGSQQPKTNLGMRAAVEHASSLGLLDMREPETKYEGLKLFGLTSMIPSLDVAVQSALQKQQAFEDWIQDPQAQQAFVQAFQQQTQQFESDIQASALAHHQQMMTAKVSPDAPVPQYQAPQPPDMLALTPLRWMKWWKAEVHMSEFMKWANDDHIRKIIGENQMALTLLETHLEQIGLNMPQAPAEPPKVNFSFAEDAMADPEVRQYFEKTTGVTPSAPPQPKPDAKPDNKGVAGGARAMKNSNDNSAPAGNKGQQENPGGKPVK